MKRKTLSRTVIIVGAGLLVVAGVILAVTFLGSGRAAPSPTAPPPTPTTSPPQSSPTPEPTVEPTASDPVVAHVNDHDITYSYWQKTVALNQVLGEFARQPSLDQSETLQRLIMSELVLQGTTIEEEPTEEEIEQYIANLEQGWGVDDETVISALESVGLERAFFEETIDRLLKVEAGVRSVREEGQDINQWLKEQEENADIEVVEGVPTPIAPTVQPESVKRPTSTPPPATQTPSPTADIPEVAPDFTLDQSGGETFTLSEQLAQGPMVLVFFQSGGG